MRLSDTVLSLLGAVTAALAAYFVGHALSSDHAGWAWVTAGVLLLVAAASIAVVVRSLRA